MYEYCYTILLLYVVDMLIIGLDKKKIKYLKEQLSDEFKMNDLSLTKMIFSMMVNRDMCAGTLKLS